MYAWEGTNEKPDHSRFNLAYWQHFDRVMDAMNRRGIVAHLMIKVYNKMVNWPAKGSAEDDLYFRWLIARYAAYPNLHWDLSKEANNEKDRAYKTGRLRFLRQNDPYRRPITVHDDRKTYDEGAYNNLADYRSDQQHSKWHATILEHRAEHNWPVVNVEFGYEHGPQGIGDKTYTVVQPPEEVCRRAWEVCMAGAYGAYYYTYTAWDVIRPQDTPPGYAYFKNLRDFFKTTGYWRMAPADELTSSGFCLAEPGQEYVVFLNNAQPFSLKVEKLAAAVKADWFQPFTGRLQDAGTVINGSAQFTPPAGWGGGPIVLHVGSQHPIFSPPRASAKERVELAYTQGVPQTEFATREIRTALESRAKLGFGDTGEVRMILASSADESRRVAANLGLTPPKSVVSQAYALRKKVQDERTSFVVLGADPAGTMYGGLDLTERIRMGTLATLVDTDHAPYVHAAASSSTYPWMPGLQAIPMLAMRPSRISPRCGAWISWREFLDEMARDRFNVLSLWNLHPFPSMVKVPEYPDVAMDDVMRTTVKFDSSYSLSGTDMVRPGIWPTWKRSRED